MSLSDRVERLESAAGITEIPKALEDMTDAELCDVIWPDGRWRAWTDTELDAQLRLMRDRKASHDGHGAVHG